MIAVITHHWVKKDKFRQAKKLLDRNGSAQSKADGFIYRATMLSKQDDRQISSVVIWENDKIYDRWKTSAERELIMGNAAKLWSKTPESERFNIVNMTDFY